MSNEDINNFGWNPGQTGGGGGRDSYLKIEDGQYAYIRLWPHRNMVTAGDVAMGRAGTERLGQWYLSQMVEHRLHWAGQRPSHTCPIVRTESGQYIGNCQSCDAGRARWDKAREIKQLAATMPTEADRKAEEAKAEALNKEATGLTSRPSYIFQVYLGPAKGGWKLYEANRSFVQWLDETAKNPVLSKVKLFGPQGATIQIHRGKNGKQVKWSFMLVDQQNPTLLVPTPPEMYGPFECWKDMRFVPQWLKERFAQNGATTPTESEPEPNYTPPPITAMSQNVFAPSTPTTYTQSQRVLIQFGEGDWRPGLYQSTGPDGILVIAHEDPPGKWENYRCAAHEVKPQ